MEPRIEQRKQFAVLGTVTAVRRGAETPELFADIWREFETLQAQIERLAVRPQYFGVSFAPEADDVTEYLAGMMVEAAEAVPQGLQKRIVPGGQLAVFDCALESIGAGYRYIFEEWLPGSVYRLDQARPVFEEYPEGASPRYVRICIPVCQ